MNRKRWWLVGVGNYEIIFLLIFNRGSKSERWNTNVIWSSNDTTFIAFQLLYSKKMGKRIGTRLREVSRKEKYETRR